MKKIVTVLGARPQFVKAAVLSRVIKQNNKIEEIIIHTGQHYDNNMSNIFFDEMEIPLPKYNLNINNQGHGAMTGQILEKIEEVLIIEQPDGVVIFGDTNSTIAGALAAKKLGIKVIHIEAGLRSFNMQMPEEINRIITDRISDLLSCPTQNALDNLANEGFNNFDIEIQNHGDIMKDAVEYYSAFSEQKSSIIKNLELGSKPFVLATIHRQENTDSPEILRDIFKGLEAINELEPVILPLHPRTKKKLKEYNITTSIKCIDPVGYFDMLELLKNCSMVVTDSGGLQKEAFFNQKYCIIARTETEWVELVNNGYAKIVGSNSTDILETYSNYTESSLDFSTPLYGNEVGEKIHDSILTLLAK